MLYSKKDAIIIVRKIPSKILLLRENLGSLS
jgi:hypothetical protein